MKSYQIKREKPVDSTYDNYYTTYKNPDPKLKQEIKSFEIDRTKVKLGWPEKEWTISEYEGEEVKCTSGKNVQYFSVNEVEEALKENEHFQRNQKFMPHLYFKKHFGILSSVHKHEKSLYVKVIDLQDGFAKGALVGLDRAVDPTTVEFYGNFYSYEVSVWKDEEIKIKADMSYCSLNLYFDKDGNYVNRDYNENLNEFTAHSDIYATGIVVDHIEKLLTTMFGKTLLHANGKYYTNKYCIVPYAYEDEFGVQIYPTTDEGKTYKKYRQPAIKRPKKLEEVPSNHLNYVVMGMVPEKMKLLLTKVDSQKIKSLIL